MIRNMRQLRQTAAVTEREILCIGVEVNSPRVNQRQVDEVSNEKRFESVILSLYKRRSPKVTEADLQNATVLLANLWVKKCLSLVSEGSVY